MTIRGNGDSRHGVLNGEREEVKMMNKNQFVAEKLGMCWHDAEIIKGEFICRVCEKSTTNFNALLKPDFGDDAGVVQLLRLMVVREDWKDFSKTLVFNIGEREYYGRDSSVALEYLLNPGALLNAVAEWFGYPGD